LGWGGSEAKQEDGLAVSYSKGVTEFGQQKWPIFVDFQAVAVPPWRPSEHGNDFFLFSAVEPDSLIAFVSARFGIFGIRLPVTVEFSQSF